MKITDIPAKFATPFANSAGAGYIRSIPATPSGTVGQASLELGFPPENFSPVAAGGVPPFGQDFNGILNQSTGWDRWQATGVIPPYDSSWQATVGGYPQGSLVQSLVELGLIYFSLVDDNVTNPDNGGAGWYIWSRIITANTDLYVNGSTGSDSNNGLSPATAVATIQAAINLAFGYPPSQFTITIHVADGTYAAAATPAYGGPNIIITGNSGTPSNVVISSSSAAAIAVRGPNTLTVQNLKVQTTGAATNYGFSSSTGSSLTTSNTVSGACAGPVFAATGGLIVPGNHTFSGNGPSFWYTTNGGYISLNNGVTYTISTPVTLSTSTVEANDGGVLQTDSSPPSFVNSGNVTGKRYQATLNGIINTQGAGGSYFPGTVAGTTATGGQYA